MDFAQLEPYRTANDQVNHSCGILIDEGTSGAPSSRIGEPRQSILHVRSFGVGTASRPVEIGALLTLSRGQTTSQSTWVAIQVFFSRQRIEVHGWSSVRWTGRPAGVAEHPPLGRRARLPLGVLRGEPVTQAGRNATSQRWGTIR